MMMKMMKMMMMMMVMMMMMMLNETMKTMCYNHTRHKSPSSEKLTFRNTKCLKVLKNFPIIVDYA